MNEKPWKAWFQENTDRWVLLFCLCVFLAVVLYAMHFDMSEGAVDWARSSTDLVLGGLLGLITGKYQAEKKAPTLETTTTQSTTITPPPVQP